MVDLTVQKEPRGTLYWSLRCHTPYQPKTSHSAVFGTCHKYQSMTHRLLSQNVILLNEYGCSIFLYGICFLALHLQDIPAFFSNFTSNHSVGHNIIHATIREISHLWIFQHLNLHFIMFPLSLLHGYVIFRHLRSGKYQF